MAHFKVYPESELGNIPNSNHPDFEPNLDQSSVNVDLDSPFFPLMVEITKKYRNRKLGMI
jgi:hypothetical protein